MAKKNEKQVYIDPKEEPISSQSINRFDIYSLKGALDDEVIAWLESNAFVEYTNYIDVKIIIYAVTCFLGYWSHFVVKFPSESHLLVVALVSYGVLMTIHYFIENQMERQAFFISKSHKMNNSKDFQEIYFISEQKETTYSLKIVAKAKSGITKEITAKHEVTELFDSYGYMHRQVVKAKVIDSFMSSLQKTI